MQDQVSDNAGQQSLHDAGTGMSSVDSISPVADESDGIILDALWKLSSSPGRRPPFVEYVDKVRDLVGADPSPSLLLKAAEIGAAPEMSHDDRTILLAVLYARYADYSQDRKIPLLQTLLHSVEQWHPTAQLQLLEKIVSYYGIRDMALVDVKEILRAITTAYQGQRRLEGEENARDVIAALQSMGTSPSLPEECRSVILEVRDDFCRRNLGVMSLSALRRSILSSAKHKSESTGATLAAEIIDDFGLKRFVEAPQSLAYVSCLLKLVTGISFSEARSLLV